MGGLVLGILRACVVVYGILGWVTAASAQFTAESLSDDDITQAIALLNRPWFNTNGYTTDSARMILHHLVHGGPPE